MPAASGGSLAEEQEAEGIAILLLQLVNSATILAEDAEPKRSPDAIALDHNPVWVAGWNDIGRHFNVHLHDHAHFEQVTGPFGKVGRPDRTPMVHRHPQLGDARLEAVRKAGDRTRKRPAELGLNLPGQFPGGRPGRGLICSLGPNLELGPQVLGNLAGEVVAKWTQALTLALRRDG